MGDAILIECNAIVEGREVREGTDVEVGVRIGKGAIVGKVCTLREKAGYLHFQVTFGWLTWADVRTANCVQ